MDKTAIHPDRFFNNIPTFTEENVGVEALADEEKALANLANHSGWLVLKDFIEAVERDLDNVNNLAISNGANFEEIGQNTVVINLAKGVIKKIKDKVEDAKEAAAEAAKHHAPDQ